MKSTTAIASTSEYNLRMQRSLIDKLFFIDKVDFDFLVDYGCADGSLLKAARSWVAPDVHLSGYDESYDMRSLAKANLNKQALTDVTGELTQLAVFLTKHKEKNKTKTCLLLSSVIHEVLNYKSPEEITRFWDFALNGRLDGGSFAKFDYVVIRDMAPSRSIDRKADPDDISRVYRKFLNRQELKDFETAFGSIENQKNLVHFLLKCKYLEPNWARECRENYIPLYREDLLAMIPDEYSVIYEEHYPLPYVRRYVREDFGIQLKDPTHLKLILERRK